MGSRDLKYILLIVALVFIGRKLYYRIYPRIRERFDLSLGPPQDTPEREKAGVVFLLVTLIGAGLLAMLVENACPRIE